VISALTSVKTFATDQVTQNRLTIDAPESAEKEIALWFPRGVKSFERGLDRLIYE
jgi:hypothetical protein